MNNESRNPFDWKYKINAHAEEVSDELRDYVHGLATEEEVLRALSQLSTEVANAIWHINRNIMEKFERAKVNPLTTPEAEL